MPHINIRVQHSFKYKRIFIVHSQISSFTSSMAAKDSIRQLVPSLKRPVYLCPGSDLDHRRIGTVSLPFALVIYFDLKYN